MIDRVVVDASVWVSRFMPTDVNHYASISWLNRFTATTGLLIEPIFVQVEIAGVLARLSKLPNLSKSAIDELNNSNAVHFVAFEDALVQSAITIAANLQLRGSDAIYVTLARQLNIPLVSWDKEQLQRASSLITTYTPSTYVF